MEGEEQEKRRGASRPGLSTACFSYFAIIFFFCCVPPSTYLSLPLCALFILPMPARPCYKQNGTKWRHLLLQIRKIRCFIKNEMSEANAKGANTHTHTRTHPRTTGEAGNWRPKPAGGSGTLANKFEAKISPLYKGNNSRAMDLALMCCSPHNVGPK